VPQLTRTHSFRLLSHQSHELVQSWYAIETITTRYLLLLFHNQVIPHLRKYKQNTW